MFRGYFFCIFTNFKSMRKYTKTICSAVAFAGVALMWALKYPFLLGFHEQNQLFLWTGDYLAGSLALPGGLADWIAEFITQFYALPWLGALLLSGVLIALQRLTWRCFETECGAWYPLSFIPSALMLCLMGDHDAMLCLAVAIAGSLALCLRYKARPSAALAMIGTLAGYWLLGPAIVIFPLYVLWRDRRLYSLVYLAALAAELALLRLTLLCQYPWRQLLLGLDYYRMPLHQPLLQVITTFSPIIAILAADLLPQVRCKFAGPVLAAAVAGLCALGISQTYDKDRLEVLALDQLVREEDWNSVIERVKECPPKSELSCVCQNLALCMTGQMKDMFDYVQCGPQGLIMPRVRDNISNAASCEVFWRLGFVNESLRYAFDTQESIANFRKSGRWMSRMAECQLVNGRYAVASKYLDILKHSLFYRKWAISREDLLWDEAAIEIDPIYGYLRSVRSQEDYLYYYPEMDKMLGNLYITNRNNMMAGWYYQAWKAMTRDEKVEDSSAGGAHGN